MPTSKLRIATRQSPLAMWQAQYIAQQLAMTWPQLDIELIPMVTSGDRFLKNINVPKGGKGLFVKELEDALLHNRADIAVHSMKDVPAHFPPNLGIMAISERENPFDALVSEHYESIHALPLHAKIGTSSLRRQSQLLAIRPDLRVETLRGNIQTRIEKLSSMPFDAILLAAAGLIRMDLQQQIKQIIPATLMLPACGQGALGIECRLDDQATHTLISPLNHPLTALCVTTERQVNAVLGGNCHAPVAVYCQEHEPNALQIQAKVLSADGQKVLSASNSGSMNTAPQMADQCAQQLLDQGARQLLDCI
ncbi:MAG: hydroxymethylbilane synthase [Legionella sp.]|nr:MAG: hydroxymethylbilane synthase [Legionella sp.]